MIYRKFGATDLEVSLIGFGCMQLGGELIIAGQPQSYGKIDEEEAKKAILLALELGINFFDTADFYGLGKSEYILGNLLKNVREKVVICTKGGTIPDGITGSSTDGSYEHIMASCNRSLKRLQTDYIDIYLLHFVPPADQIKESTEVLKELKKVGKIREFGISVAHDLERIPDLVDDFPAIEGYYNLLLKKYENYLPLMKEKGTCFIAASPLSRSLLTGKDYDNVKFSDSDVRKKWEKGEKHYSWYNQQTDGLLKLKRYAEMWDIPLKNLGLAYILSNDISTAIPGMKSRQQVTELVKSLEYVPLDKEKIDKLKNI